MTYIKPSPFLFTFEEAQQSVMMFMTDVSTHFDGLDHQMPPALCNGDGDVFLDHGHFVCLLTKP
jgi:hypothetical protein